MEKGPPGRSGGQLFSQNLLFIANAVVKTATNKRTTRDGIDIIDAVLIDDSRAETGELATVVVSVWGEEKVNEVFGAFGKITSFSLNQDKKGRRSAFINFETVEHARACVEAGSAMFGLCLLLRVGVWVPPSCSIA